jgi:hypothetical protein
MDTPEQPFNEDQIKRDAERIKRITEEQKQKEKKDILDRLKQFSESRLSDENLDRHNEKFDVSQYRKHNPKTAFIRDEPKTWRIKFPMEYYELICKLKGWPDRYAHDRPGVVGRWTNIFIYKMFPFGILQIIEQKNQIDSSGNRPYKHHQFLTDAGELELEKFLFKVIALMRRSQSWSEFKRLFAKENGLPYQSSLFD